MDVVFPSQVFPVKMFLHLFEEAALKSYIDSQALKAVILSFPDEVIAF